MMKKVAAAALALAAVAGFTSGTAEAAAGPQRFLIIQTGTRK